MTMVGEECPTAIERRESVKPILGFFIDQHRHITKFRLQKLVFYAESEYYREHGERLTKANWNARMYGMKSSDITEALEDFEKNGGETTLTLEIGKCATAYTAPPTEHSLDSATQELLEDVSEKTKPISTTELYEWTKDHPLFSSTRYEQHVDFSKLEHHC